MTRIEIYDLLKSVFLEFEVRLSDKSTWSKIYVGKNLEVYTYGGFPENTNSVWYFNLYFNGSGKEVMIPNKDSKEFIQVFKEIYLDVLKSGEIIKSVTDRLNTISDPSNIRNFKIKNIIDYDSNS
jgi:hypothetical protein